MPRQFGKRDQRSLGWPVCGDCSNRHDPAAGCTRPRVWLVATICEHCTATRYCRSHNAHVR